MPATTRIRLRSGTASEWAAANPVLLSGEVGYETDTNLAKVGNGTTAWSSLASSLGGLTANDVARFMGWADGTIEPRPRSSATAALTVSSTNVHWTQFTPAVTMTVSQITMMSGTTAASGLTLARMGVYSINSSGQPQTLLAQTASDTTLFTAASTLYTRSFNTTGGYPASLTLTAGTRYAIAQVVVGSNGGNRLSYAQMAVGAAVPPIAANGVNGASDLPVSPTGTIVNAAAVWGRLS